MYRRFELPGKWRHKRRGTKYVRVYGFNTTDTLVQVETEAGSIYHVRKRNIEKYKEGEPMAKPNTIGLGEYSTDDLITELENRGVVPKIHSARIAFGDFSMRHTLRCSVDDMRTCPYHIWLNDQYMANGGMSPFSPAGEYAMKMDKKGDIKMMLVNEDKESI